MESERSCHSTRRFGTSPPLGQETVGQGVSHCRAPDDAGKSTPTLSRRGKYADMGRLTRPALVAGRRHNVCPAAHHERGRGDFGEPALVGIIRRNRGEEGGQIGMTCGNGVRDAGIGWWEVALVAVGQGRWTQHFSDRQGAAHPVGVGQGCDRQSAQSLPYELGDAVRGNGDDRGVAERDDPAPTRRTQQRPLRDDHLRALGGKGYGDAGQLKPDLLSPDDQELILQRAVAFLISLSHSMPSRRPSGNWS